MSKITLSALVAALIPLVFTAIQFFTGTGLTLATGWPTLIVGICGLAYGFFKKNSSNFSAGTLNVAFSTIGCIAAIGLAVQSIVLTGSFDLKSALPAIAVAVIGVLDGNPNELNAIAGMFSKVGVTYPTTSTQSGSGN